MMIRSFLAVILVGLTCRASAASQGSSEGKLFPPSLTKNIPQPAAFFPLTEGSGDHVASFPNPTYLGTLNGSIPWVKDDVFGSVLRCSRANDDLIILDPVDYAAMGPFSINMWVKANATDMDGDLFQYFFSHSGYATRQNYASVDTFHPNQVHVYLPENGHPATGLVRTIVKDSTNLDTSSFLDSDGHYGDNTARNQLNSNPVDDGAWHMVTVTTHQDGTAGFQVYIDGNLAASLPSTDPKALNATMDNVNLLLDGGRPIFLQNGAIYLCGRADGDPTRSFSGSVSHLSLFATVLTAAQIRDLYRTVLLDTLNTFRSQAASPLAGATPGPATAPVAGTPQTFAAPGVSLDPAPSGDSQDLAGAPISAMDLMMPSVAAPAPAQAQQLTIAGRPCQFPFFYRGEARTQCVPYSSSDSSAFCLDVDGRFSMCSPTLTSDYSSFISWMDQWAGMGQLQTMIGANAQMQVVLCSINGTGTGSQKNCGPGFVCAPLSRADLNAEASFNANSITPQPSLAGTGIGVCADPNGVTLPVGGSMPVPTAYFPLTNGSITSWPVPQYWAYNSSAIRAKQTKFVPDDLFGSVASCNASVGSSMAIEGVKWGSTGPFAFNVWVKQASNKGSMFQYVISTRARDLGNVTDDNIFYPNQVHVYLPSKEHPAHDTVRAIVKDSTDNFSGDNARVFVDSDGVIASNNERTTIRTPVLGGWHMLTVTTMQDGTPGFRLYVDGIYRAALSAPQDFFQIDGGRPIYADGPIVLCDRADHFAGRSFDGKIAQLSVYDAALTENNIALLYAAVSGVMPDYSKSPLAQAAAAAKLTPAAAPAAPVAVPRSAPVAVTQNTETLSSSQTTSSGSSAAAGGGGSIAAAPKPALRSSQSRGPVVPNPADQQSGVTGTAADQSSVLVNSASVSSGPKLAPAAIIGIVVAAVVVVAILAGVVVFVARKRRHGGNWQKEHLDDEGAAGASAAQHTSFPDSQEVPKRASPDKSKLFTGAPSHSFALEAHSTL
ncbi:hypothetical protein WJX75_007350 [Coccomyxa subellipsoidea]|uniref:Concanavalin A-like lectin/glucanase n=1 Tax=Coccomyxa subellipsoidea TaxID=248742 RepID=A0ABR2Z291_9CHLO